MAALIACAPNWRPVTESELRPAPVRDERDVPMDFVLTPRERDAVQLARLDLERNRRRRNAADRAMANAENARLLSLALGRED